MHVVPHGCMCIRVSEMLRLRPNVSALLSRGLPRCLILVLFLLAYNDGLATWIAFDKKMNLEILLLPFYLCLTWIVLCMNEWACMHIELRTRNVSSWATWTFWRPSLGAVHLVSKLFMSLEFYMANTYNSYNVLLFILRGLLP